MDTKNYRYILERHLPGSRTKYECPSCGKLRCFTRFVDTRTGQYVADEVGICDHSNNCGYILKPWEYFDMHPELDRNSYQGNGTTANNPDSTKRRILPPLYLPIGLVGKFHSKESTFFRFLQSISPDNARLEQVYEDYLLGANNEGAVIFWQIDRKGYVREGKIMHYTDDGHRSNEHTPNFVGTKYKGILDIPDNFSERRKWCLFGEHLLHVYPEKKVRLVESEKTAVICSLFYTDCIWLATGGCGMLNTEVVRVLDDRWVEVYPDSGCYDKWKAILANSILKNYTVSKCLEDYPGNTDLADVLLKDLNR